jgi:hypothetical protein
MFFDSLFLNLMVVKRSVWWSFLLMLETPVLTIARTGLFQPAD